MGGIEKIGNQRNAATKTNQPIWQKRHNVSTGPMQRLKVNPVTGVRVGAFGGVTFFYAMIMHREMQMSNMLMAPYVLHDENGIFTISSGRHRRWARMSFYKNYIEGDLAGQSIAITRAEFNFWAAEARALWGYVDIWGNFVPGLLQPELPIIEKERGWDDLIIMLESEVCVA